MSTADTEALPSEGTTATEPPMPPESDQASSDTFTDDPFGGIDTTEEPPQELDLLPPPQRLFPAADWGMNTPSAQSRRLEARAHLDTHLDTVGDETAEPADRKASAAYLLRYRIDVAEILHTDLGVDQAIARASAIRGMSVDIAKLRGECRSIQKQAEKAQAKAEKQFTPSFRPSEAVAGPAATFPDLPMELRWPDNYLIDSGTILRRGPENEKGERALFEVATRPMALTGRAQDVDTHEHHREVSWVADNGRIHKGWLERDQLMESRKVVALAKLGAPVVSTFAGEVSRFLDAMDSAWSPDLPIQRVASRCGDVAGTDGGFLLGNRWIPTLVDPPTHEGLDTSPVSLRPPTGYEALSASISPHGTEAHWLSAWALAADRPIARFAVYAALSSVLLPWTVRRGCVLDLHGRSSIGKTTTLLLAASVFGDPMGYIGKWSSTPTYRERSAALLHSLPHMLDDTRQVSAKERETIGQTVYQLADGQGKGRGFVFGAQRRATWCSWAFSTGESPLLGTSQDEGARARCLSVEGAPFGSREHAAQVAMTVERHYGHFGPKFIRAMLDLGPDSILSAYDSVLPYWVERCSAHGPIATRLAAHLAAVQVAAEIAHSECGLPLPEGMAASLEVGIQAAIASSQDADKPLAALRTVLSRCTAQQASFFGRHEIQHGTGDAKQPTQGWLGRWDKGARGGPGPDQWKCVAVSTPTLKRWLKEEGFDVMGILAQWNERCWLLIPANAKPGTYDRPTWVDGQAMRCIAIEGAAAHEAMCGDSEP